VALWTPANTTTRLWLDGSDANTLYDATSGGSLVSAGGSIARWEDKSGNAEHATQSTSGARPTRQTNVQNGLAVVRFDGSDDLLSRSTNNVWRNLSWGAIYAVRKIDAVTNVPWIIGIGTNAAATTVRALMDLNRGSTSKSGAGGRRLDADTFASVQGATNYSTTVFQIQGAVFDYANTTLQVRVNGSTDGQSTSFQTAGSVADTSSAGFNVGANPGTAFFDGDIGELIVSTAKSDHERFEGYLAWKWGLQGSLPAGHPYKNAAPAFASDEAGMFGGISGGMTGGFAT